MNKRKHRALYGAKHDQPPEDLSDYCEHGIHQAEHCDACEAQVMAAIAGDRRGDVGQHEGSFE